MSSALSSSGSDKLIGMPSTASRFDELLHQLRHEHLQVVKQLREEFGAQSGRHVGPRSAGRMVSFGTLEEVDVSPPEPPKSQLTSPEKPPLEMPSMVPDRASPVLIFHAEDDPGFSGPTSGAIERVQSLSKEGVGAFPTKDPMDHSSGFRPERSPKRTLSQNTTNSMYSTATSDSNNGVKHVRRMLNKWGKSGSQSSLDSACSVETGQRSTAIANFVSSKVRGFLESTEEADLFKNTNSRNSDVNIFHKLRKVVTSPTFELVFAVLIFVNTLVLAIEAQHDGLVCGYENEFVPSEKPTSDVWPGAKQAFTVLELGFGIIFTVEITMKILASRRAFFKDLWNAIDFIIVLFWLLEHVFKAFLPLDPKIVRMARLARLLRFLRIVKTIQAFDSLYLMVSSIKSSFSALAWSSVVLLLGEMMLALFLNILLEAYWSDPTNLMEDREELYAYFGTFTKALQTMIEMLLGNWYTITRVLTSKVSEWYMIFGITHQLVVGFAVIEVITGVFLHETFKVANLDDGILLNETKREIKDQTEKMMRFFHHADIDENGELDREEFREVLARDKVQEWMNAQGLDVHNIDRVFCLFDQDRNGRISPEELIAGTLNLKGQAKAMDLAVVRAMVEDIHHALKMQMPRERSRLYSRASDTDRRRGRAWSSSEDK